MKIGHWQLACFPGKTEANIEKVLDGLRTAAREDVHLVSFPESMLTGYYRDREAAWRNSFVLDGPEISRLLRDSAWYDGTFMVGFNERRGVSLRNTVLVARQGQVLGTYSKAFPCFSYFEPGRDFPVFDHDGLCFGVIICADGGYIEPARILALKGARVIFAPHYNYIRPAGLIQHFMRVRADHIARARENGVWFLRGNNVVFGRDEGLLHEGIGYGDSYVIDPEGEIFVRSRRHVETFLTADIPLDHAPDYCRRNLDSARALLPQLQALVDQHS